MTPKEDDIPVIKALFEEKKFDGHAFLQGLSADKEAFAAYLAALEKTRLQNHYVNITLETIPNMKALKAGQLYDAFMFMFSCFDAVVCMLGCFEHQKHH